MFVKFIISFHVKLSSHFVLLTSNFAVLLLLCSFVVVCELSVVVFIRHIIVFISNFYNNEDFHYIKQISSEFLDAIASLKYN